jgi:intein/homing endonuclease
MRLSGAKGSPINATQIGGILGQQNIDGKRMPKSLAGNSRCLPCFKPNSPDPRSRGFVAGNYYVGLDPVEQFFHAAAGRRGLIDTAIKSVTGDTPIIIIENGTPRRVLIGEWIDAHINLAPSKVKHYENLDMEYLKISSGTYIPTTDSDGNVTWGDVIAVTRHDPGKVLYKIRTLGGSNVTVVESMSLLIWNKIENKFLPTLTSNVKVGDYMPTTLFLPNTQTTQYIDVANYLPKNKFVYGSDFLIAANLINAMPGNSPSGWWNKNNGSTFTLPYSKNHKMLRVQRRSDMSNIKKGCVYPYHGKRINTYIPDRMILDRDNGVFIGLFLAEGNARVKSGSVDITNNDETIQNVVKKWFDKFSIKWHYNTAINHIGGTSSTVRGFSTVMADLITQMVGHGAAHKRVPVEAFTAPDEFIKGLIDGYISGDGTITRNAIEATSASKELIEGISVLCSRLGIFCKVSKRTMTHNNLGTENIAPINSMSIRSQWATKFSKMITLSHPGKQDQLSRISCSSVHRNFPEHNDVVLDKIVSIESVDVQKYPKVYDLTIPSTLNFCLANGLHVVDTSGNSYIDFAELLFLVSDQCVNLRKKSAEDHQKIEDLMRKAADHQERHGTPQVLGEHTTKQVLDY